MEETNVATVSDKVGQAAVSEGVETASDIEGSVEGSTERPEVTEGVEAKAGEEGKEDVEGGEDKPPHKLPANERIQQLVNEKNELKGRIEEIEKKFEESQKIAIEEEPFINIDTKMFNEKVTSLMYEIEVLKVEDKSFEAAKKQREVNRLLDAFDENEIKRQEWVKQQIKKKEAVMNYKAKLKYVDDTAEFYRKEMNIPQDVWNAGAKFFTEVCKENPVLSRKFAEKIDSSPMEGIDFAYSYVKENMGKKAEAVKKEKEEAKDRLISTGSSSGISAGEINTFEELHKLSGDEIDKFAKEHPIKYKRIFEKRFKGG